MSDREPMTKEGEVALQSELQTLLKDRPKICLLYTSDAADD